MKSFDEFLSTTNWQQVMDDVIRGAQDNPDPVSASVNASVTVTIDLLRAYHEWMSE